MSSIKRANRPRSLNNPNNDNSILQSQQSPARGASSKTSLLQKTHKYPIAIPLEQHQEQPSSIGLTQLVGQLYDDLNSLARRALTKSFYESVEEKFIYLVEKLLTEFGKDKS